MIYLYLSLLTAAPYETSRMAPSLLLLLFFFY